MPGEAYRPWSYLCFQDHQLMSVLLKERKQDHEIACLLLVTFLLREQFFGHWDDAHGQLNMPRRESSFHAVPKRYKHFSYEAWSSENGFVMPVRSSTKQLLCKLCLTFKPVKLKTFSFDCLVEMGFLNTRHWFQKASVLFSSYNSWPYLGRCVMPGDPMGVPNIQH